MLILNLHDPLIARIEWCKVEVKEINAGISQQIIPAKNLKIFLAPSNRGVILYVEAREMTNREKEDFWAEVEGGVFLFAFVLAPILTVILLLCRFAA
jgi:hypothetical protein